MNLRPILLALAVAASPAAASSTQLSMGVARDLPTYGFDVSVDDLSTAQLAALHHIMHNSQLSTSDKRRQIKSILGGPYSLRGLLLGS